MGYRTPGPLPDCLTVQIDTREKYPIPFPSNIRVEHPLHCEKSVLIPIKTERICLHAGDYRLKQYSDCCVIERKGSQLELQKNLFNLADMVRTAKAFRCLSAVQHPVLLVEVSPVSLLATRPEVPTPEQLMQRLMMVAAKYGLQLICVPQTSSTSSRRAMGLMLIHLMLAYGLASELDLPLNEIKENDTTCVVPGGELVQC